MDVFPALEVNGFAGNVRFLEIYLELLANFSVFDNLCLFLDKKCYTYLFKIVVTVLKKLPEFVVLGKKF